MIKDKNQRLFFFKLTRLNNSCYFDQQISQSCVNELSTISFFLTFTDDCEPNPCKNGNCTDNISEVWNVTCACEAGWEGDFCQVNIDDCASDPCQNGATCHDYTLYYICECASGWEGKWEQCGSLKNTPISLLWV